MFCEVLTNTKGENWLNYHALHDGSMLVNTQQKTTSCFSSLKCPKKKKHLQVATFLKIYFSSERYPQKKKILLIIIFFQYFIIFCGSKTDHYPTQIILHFSFYMSFQDHKGRHTIISKDKWKQKHASNLIKY